MNTQKLTAASLDQLAADCAAKVPKNLIRVGMSTCGIAAGAEAVLATLRRNVAARGLKIAVEQCGCAGMCYAEPLVEVAVEGMPTVTYGRVTPQIAGEIIEQHVERKLFVQDYIYTVKVDDEK
ncbi:MAG: (2Fe-2S) ferredoxin domain-containing protein [Candidatus Omnitrophica bacterium]|nr:(2Fe-2S) ferredoxin domain-containing protein [Candidatus Omnitrophota bacterium]